MSGSTFLCLYNQAPPPVFTLSCLHVTARSAAGGYSESLLVTTSLEDTEQSCVARRPRPDGELLKGPAPSVTFGPGAQSSAVSSTASPSGAAGLSGDGGRRVEAAACRRWMCLAGTPSARSGADQLSFLFCNVNGAKNNKRQQNSWWTLCNSFWSYKINKKLNVLSFYLTKTHHKATKLI